MEGRALAVAVGALGGAARAPVSLAPTASRSGVPLGCVLAETIRQPLVSVPLRCRRALAVEIGALVV